MDGSLIDALYAALFPPPTGGYVPLPMLCPGSSHLYAHEMHVEPLFTDQVNNNPGGAFNTYGLVKATVTWRNVAYIQYNHSLITRRVRAGGKFAELANTHMMWADETDPSKQIITNPEVVSVLNYISSDCEIKIHRSPTNPLSTFDSCGGCANRSVFMGIPAECLMFNDVDVDELVTPGGSLAYDITLKFNKRIIGGDPTIDWNYIYDVDSKRYRQAMLTNGDYPHPYVDFEQLIP